MPRYRPLHVHTPLALEHAAQEDPVAESPAGQSRARAAAPGPAADPSARESSPRVMAARPAVGPSVAESSARLAAAGPAADPAAPAVPITALDQLWFQVAGTICNLRCKHCFISCNPHNHAFWFLDRTTILGALEQSVGLGVKEYYFTGGEPFMHPLMATLLADTLAVGPATVLTNGTLLVPRIVRALTAAAESSPYSLEIRVSLDGVTPETNDAIRGADTFRRALGGIEQLVAAGFLPIVTAMQSWPDDEGDAVLDSFRAALHAIGYDRPRLRILPTLFKGEEATRTRGYLPEERVTHEMLHGFDLDRLLCTRARLVTARGVWACPILLDAPVARLGDTLADAAARPAILAEQACYTCWRSGAICSNAASLRRDA